MKHYYDKSSMKWTKENTRSVREYQKKVESGQIKPIKLDKPFKELFHQ